MLTKGDVDCQDSSPTISGPNQREGEPLQYSCQYVTHCTGIVILLEATKPPTALECSI